MPQTELLKDKGYEIFYCTDDVDEFALKILTTYKEKAFKSVSDGDLGIEETEEEKKAIEEKAEKDKDLLEAMKNALEGKVKDVTLSQRLKDHPVCIVSGGEVSLEMEKVLNSMPTDEKISAEKILEINANHSILSALEKVYKTDKDSIAKYANLLYNQALLMEGLPIEDPVEFSNNICEIIEKNGGK
jgi:molecular chaperone HtpG